MMTREKKLSIVLICSVGFNVAFVGVWLYHLLYIGPALAQVQRQQAALNAQGTQVLRKLDELQLAPAQREKIMAQQAGLGPQVAEAIQKARDARTELIVLMQDPNADPEALGAAEQKFAAEQQKIRQMVFEHLIRVRGTLNDDQRRQFGRMFGPGRLQGRGPMVQPRRPGQGQNPNDPPPGRPDGPKGWEEEPSRGPGPEQNPKDKPQPERRDGPNGWEKEPF